MAEMHGAIEREPRVKLVEERIIQIKIPRSQLISKDAPFEETFITEIDLGEEAAQLNIIETEKAIRKVNEKTPLTDMGQLETFPQTVELYNGWRTKMEDVTIQTVSGITNFKLYKGLPTEKVPFSQFKKRKIE
jgi:hypothetical protein